MFNNSPLSERVKRLRKRYRDTINPRLSIERLRLITEYYQEHEAEPIELKRAGLLGCLSEKSTLFVSDDELLVGNISPYYHGSTLFPEYGINWLFDELRSGEFESRSVQEEAFYISPEDKEYLLSCEEYWSQRSVSARMYKAVPDEFFDMMPAGVTMFGPANMCDQPTGHFCTGYSRAIDKGFGAIRDEARRKMAELSNRCYGHDAEKYLFYKSIAISCDAAINFSKRYASICRDQANAAENENRKKELLQMADTLDWIMENPCRSFREAIQCLLLYQHVLIYEGGIHGLTLGRVDQYLGKYLKKDLDSGVITIEEAQELTDCFCLKICDIVKVWSRISSRNSGGFTSGQHISLGGVKEDGTDAANEFTYLILATMARLQLHDPTIDIRIHSGTPRELWEAAIETTKAVGGIPTLQNDDVIIPSLINFGIEPADARNYCIIGCVEPGICGSEWPACGGTGKESYWNMLNCLLLAVNNGINPRNGKQAGLPTGYLYEMKSFDEVKAAFEKQLEFFVNWQITLINTYEYVTSNLVPLPIASATMEGCMEKGMDVTRGGAKYNSTGMSGIGSSNVGDSLAAIKYFIFDTKQYTTLEFYDAFINNWKNAEMIRQQILHFGHHFGNDDDYVDELTVWATDLFGKYVSKGYGPRGKFRPGLYPVSAHVALGKLTSASPDGRVSGEPLSDGISPKQGLDRNGPVSVLRSCGKLHHVNFGNGTLLNMKIHPNTMQGEGAVDKFISMVRSYFSMGGMHLQYNILSSDTLRDAQKNPDQYSNLVIRVAGFSAYFVELYKDLQDELISRTDLEC